MSPHNWRQLVLRAFYDHKHITYAFFFTDLEQYWMLLRNRVIALVLPQLPANNSPLNSKNLIATHTH
jgi:hypothetical protein